MPSFLTQSISCHFASSECYYIDVKNTTQEHVEKEIVEMAHKKYDVTSVTLKSINCRFASSERYCADVKNTTREHLRKEGIEFGHAEHTATSASDLVAILSHDLGL
ncbi:PREDICTED: phytanoyl-CoA dioxygenase, peroxisomal [Leptosomus discolor]|uniref:phytanoyl-CoA dioxygenase, peroxisomal n=1 Tax=Leptosomus discolor TaxID=188344 RepID=UPI000522A5C7|nr:PREDICTED: phytanoyl-CoA dioxygenase, peroxisomal [Leptosomus discolor]